jgi:hypothetical protein
MQYGFSFIGDEDCPKPQCVVCGEVSNGSMKLSVRLRHLPNKTHQIWKQGAEIFSATIKASWLPIYPQQTKIMKMPLKPPTVYILDKAEKVVNFIKSKPTDSRLFKALCEGMNSFNSSLLFHTQVRWLSRGKVLTRLFELGHGILTELVERVFSSVTFI